MKTSKVEIVKASKKGVLYSDYKLTYKGQVMFCFLNTEYRTWNLQETDGGDPCDSMDTLKECKATFENYVEMGNL